MATNLLNLIRFTSPAAAQFLIAGIWQGVVLAALAYLSLRLYPKVSSGARFVAWMFVLVLLAVLPFFSVCRAWSPLHLDVARSTAIPVSTSLLHLSTGWAIAVDCLWAMASLVALLTLFSQALQLRHLAAKSESIAPDLLDASLQQMLCRNSRRPVELRLSESVDAPSVIGFLRPAIILPRWLWGKLTPAELSQIVMHELAHLERGDDWTNLAQKLLRVLFPLNPALLWVERRLCTERERACDEAVLASHSVAPREYAACLARIAEKRMLRRSLPLAPGAWAARPELSQRIHNILDRKRQADSRISSAIVGVSLCVYLCGALTLGQCPQMISFVTAPQSAQPAYVRSQARVAIPLSPSSSSFLGTARYEAASFHVPVRQRAIVHAPARVAMLRPVRRTRWSPANPSQIKKMGVAHLQLLSSQFSPGFRPETGSWLILTVWHPSFETPALVLFQSDPSQPSLAFFNSRNSDWIVFQI